MDSKYKINPLVLVATPTLETRPVSWDWMDAMANLQFPLGASISKLRVTGKDVAEARNEICQTALEMGADWVLMIGDDNLPPPNLFALLHRHRAPLVTGVYWQKSYPTHPYLWDGLLKGFYEDWKYGEYFHVTFGGCDALLLSTEVLRAVPFPWFSRDWTFEEGQVPGQHFTEDFYFYSKALEAGYPLMVDSAAQLGHQDRSTGIIFGLTTEMKEYFHGNPSASESPVLEVADVGCGRESPWFGPNARITRFDVDPAVNPDYRCDIRALPAHDDSFDIVSSRHVLEHFMWQEAPLLVREWLRTLRPGGEFRVNVPNLAYAAAEITKADADQDYDAGLYPLWQVYGRQDGSFGEVHRNGFTRHSLRRLLEYCGLERVTVEVAGEFGENLQASGYKSLTATKPMAIGPVLRATMDPPASPTGGASSAAGAEPVLSAPAPPSPLASIGDAIVRDREEQREKTPALSGMTVDPQFLGEGGA